MVGKYKVITLCGSTRFRDAFLQVQKELTLKGYIVISVGLFGHGGDAEVWENMEEGTLTQTKQMLDDMHKRKIDMADEIYVINVGDYIGDSTRDEIAYAKTHGKRVNYLEPHKVMFEDPTEHQPGAPLPWEREVTHSDADMAEDVMHENPDSRSTSGASEGTAGQQADPAPGQPEEDKADSDLEMLENFMRNASRGPQGIYSPDDATAALIAYQNGMDEDKGDGEEDADPDAEEARKAYILDMLKNGYDIPNTAYFLDMDEKEVKKIWDEAQGK